MAPDELQAARCELEGEVKRLAPEIIRLVREDLEAAKAGASWALVDHAIGRLDAYLKARRMVDRASAKRGGATTFAKYGSEHYSRIAKKAWANRRARKGDSA